MIMNFISLLLPSVLVGSINDAQKNIAATIVFYVAGALINPTLIPTPIEIVAYFKPCSENEIKEVALLLLCEGKGSFE